MRACASRRPTTKHKTSNRQAGRQAGGGGLILFLVGIGSLSTKEAAAAA